MYGIAIEPKSGVSQYRQIYVQLREKIISGGINAGEKIASSRELSKSLRVSRSIVMEVIDQLKVEGFLETRKGSGTYVLESLIFRAGFSQSSFIKGSSTPVYKNLKSYIPGKPDVGLFPRRSWNSCYTKAVEYSDSRDLSYPPILGREDLRGAILNYLFRVRGIKASMDQIVITCGSSQALAILAQLKKDPRVVLENPVATFVYNIFKEYNSDITFAEIDNEGIVPSSIPKKSYDYVYITPSHQFPLGGVLSGSRRIELLKYANRNRSYIIEDDYDSEYRYSERPISPLFSLGSDRVIYIGSFSKILSPAIRLGYMILPLNLVEDVRRVKSRWDMLTESLSQKAMFNFIHEGYLEKHIRKMLKVYRSRNSYIKELISKFFGNKVNILGDSTGLHIVLEFSGASFDSDFENKMLSKGVRIFGVNHYGVGINSHSNKLIIGYGDKDESELDELFELLNSVVNIKI